MSVWVFKINKGKVETKCQILSPDLFDQIHLYKERNKTSNVYCSGLATTLQQKQYSLHLINTVKRKPFGLKHQNMNTNTDMYI